MEHVGHVDHISEAFIWRDQVGLMTKELGKAVGNKKLYVNLDSVPPGAYSTKYHTHSMQEEFFYVLAGQGTLRVNKEERTVTAGDFLGKPAGQNIAHTFYNHGTEPLLILDIGTVEGEDTCYYPEEDVFLHRICGKSHAYRGGDVLSDWNSEPNA